MNRAIAFCSAFIFAVRLVSPASAGDWQWGCLGKVGDEQILFSRYTLVITAAKPPLGKLEELFRVVDLPAQFPDTEAYDANQSDGLQKTMTYTSQSDPKKKPTLTEKSSKMIAHRHHLVCGRDEDTNVERNTYRIERAGVPAVDATLECREYLLTTRGGRPCISN